MVVGLFFAGIHLAYLLLISTWVALSVCKALQRFRGGGCDKLNWVYAEPEIAI